MTTTDFSDIAACGLFCGNCGSHTRGRCVGCKAGGGMVNNCQIRTCVADKGYVSCGECAELETCEFVNPTGLVPRAMGKVMSLVFRSDKAGNLQYLKEHGPEAFVEYKRQQGKI
ncbi:MAG: DUF3795 domain-containing protein [Chloroflexi bacterium]|nr:DUF3795 domain-containing protein [Chloroflexota bacterium]MBU1748644.1 DUF3795 domain-containing protein [Chloroflexota bacterium]